MKRTVNPSARNKSRLAIFPPSINRGDIIGLIAPAGPLTNKDDFIAGVRILEKRGFGVRYNQRLLDGKGYLAGSDQDRADEFNKLWADPEVKALMAARGGYGSMRMVDMLDMKQIRKIPKILVGFSDLTVLLAAVHLKTRLVTYHGPVVTTLAGIDKKSQTSFFNMLNGETPDLFEPSGIKTVKQGKARGILLGGNLTTLVHMIATPYEIPWGEAILFLEDIGEAPYRLDRLLTHLGKAGRLQKIKGLILGTFSDENRKENRSMLKTVHKRIAELLEGTDIPVWADFPVGHSRRNLTLPIGAEVEMDSYAGKLELTGRI